MTDDTKTAAGTDTQRRKFLLRRGARLEYFTVGYNLLEGFVAVGAGLAAGSIALVGFGLDSVIEVVAGGAVLWRLQREMRPAEGVVATDHEAREKKALLIVGITFFALALYILLEAGYNLITSQETQESQVGIALAAVSLMVMPFLALLKQRTGQELKSRALMSDAIETWMCSYLSAVLLMGLVLNAALGWSWADPLAALAMLPLVLREGWEAIEEAMEEEQDE